MFGYLIMYGNCLPTSWQEDEVVTVSFLSGDFDLIGFAQSICPMASSTPFLMPIDHGGAYRTWAWTGALDDLEQIDFPVGYHCFGCKASTGLCSKAITHR
jgi:hypothetical protein